MVKGAGHRAIRAVFRRTFVHADMERAARMFAGGTLSDRWKSVATNPVPQELREVARAFIQLQQSRHDADYDLGRQFLRSDVNDLIEMSEKAVEAWEIVRDTTDAHAFLIALLVDHRVRRSQF